jgi:hypothetical protein
MSVDNTPLSLFGGPSPFYVKQDELTVGRLEISPVVPGSLSKAAAVMERNVEILKKEAAMVTSYRRALEDVRTWLNSQNDDLHGDYEEIEHILHGVGL